jgi:predicted ester cyclase
MDNKTVVLNFMKAIDNSDFDAASRIFGSRHKMYSPMGPEPLNQQQHVEMAKGFSAGFTNARHEVLDTIESGNKVVVRGIWHGTHTGTFNNIPPSGKTIHWPFILIAEVENGEMVNQWMEMDSMSMLIQVGAMPAPQMA